MHDTTYKIIPTHLLHSVFILRPASRTLLSHSELTDSIKANGIIQPLIVRNSLRFNGSFDIVDGHRRRRVAGELNLPSVPCVVVSDLVDDVAVMALQVQLSGTQLPVPAKRFKQRTKQITQRFPNLTLAQLSEMLCKSPTRLLDILSIRSLAPSVVTMVERGEIPILTAMSLLQMPPRHRSAWLEHARIMSGARFHALIRDLFVRPKKALRLFSFKPGPHLRRLRDVYREADQPKKRDTILAAEKCKTMQDAWKAALQWVMQSDSTSIQDNKQAIINRETKKRGNK